MDTKTWLPTIRQLRAIAVIRAPELELGRQMAHAVAAGGMTLLEITWNSDRAAHLIHQLRLELPNHIIGTGTLLTLNQMRDAISAGAQFLFTPHVATRLIERAVDEDVPIVAGALSPTEILTAWQAGATSVKVFPVQAVGGAEYIKSLQGPLREIPLIPTGGVTLENAREFFAAGAVAVGLSGQLFPQKAMQTGDWAAITSQAQTLMNQLKEM